VSVSHIVARRVCSKCSKLGAATHLAAVAANAVRDYDLDRALELLERIRALGGDEADGTPAKREGKG
jgi:hypothetical protein